LRFRLYLLARDNRDAPEQLPHLTIRFGVEENVSVKISAWDYVMESLDEDRGKSYLLPIANHEEAYDRPKYTVLGSPFPGGVYAVYDQERECFM
jgi:hypothetical protein